MGFWDNSIVKSVAQGVDRGFNAIGVKDIPFITNPYAPKAPTPSKPAPKPPVNLTPAPVANDNAAFMSGLNAQIAALQRQLAYQPKLPSFDIMANYNRARSQAEAAVNPLYDKYLRDFLAGQEVSRTNKRTEVGIQKEGIAQELQRSLEGNQVNRVRTSEDVNNAITDLNTKEGQFQEASGTQFDVDRRALAEDVAASGLTSSGIGQGKIYDQNNARNLDEGQQVQEYTNQRAAKRLFETRTFEDLARGDKEADQISTNKNKMADFDLEQYLDELATNETQFRNENEAKRLGDVAGQTETYDRAGTQSFLSSLAGAGWRPQDIQLAYQIYG
jgi:hypothetical protein